MIQNQIIEPMIRHNDFGLLGDDDEKMQDSQNSLQDTDPVTPAKREREAEETEPLRTSTPIAKRQLLRAPSDANSRQTEVGEVIAEKIIKAVRPTLAPTDGKALSHHMIKLCFVIALQTCWSEFVPLLKSLYFASSQ